MINIIIIISILITGICNAEEFNGKVLMQQWQTIKNHRDFSISVSLYDVGNSRCWSRNCVLGLFAYYFRSTGICLDAVAQRMNNISNKIVINQMYSIVNS